MQLATKYTLLNIADYLLKGRGEWFEVTANGDLVFKDGNSDPPGDMSMMKSFR